MSSVAKNFLLFVVMMVFFASCTALMYENGINERKTWMLDHPPEYAGRTLPSDPSFSNPKFWLCMVCALATTCLFVVLVYSSPVFRYIVALGLALYIAGSAANSVKRWWHKP